MKRMWDEAELTQHVKTNIKASDIKANNAQSVQQNLERIDTNVENLTDDVNDLYSKTPYVDVQNPVVIEFDWEEDADDVSVSLDDSQYKNKLIKVILTGERSDRKHTIIFSAVNRPVMYNMKINSGHIELYTWWDDEIGLRSEFNPVYLNETPELYIYNYANQVIVDWYYEG